MFFTSIQLLNFRIIQTTSVISNSKILHFMSNYVKINIFNFKNQYFISLRIMNIIHLMVDSKDICPQRIFYFRTSKFFENFFLFTYMEFFLLLACFSSFLEIYSLSFLFVCRIVFFFVPCYEYIIKFKCINIILIFLWFISKQNSLIFW